MAEQQSLLPWEEKFISGQMSPEELRERLGGGFADRLHELAAQYGQAGEDGEYDLEQFTPGMQDHMLNRPTTQGGHAKEDFANNLKSGEDAGAFEKLVKGTTEFMGKPVIDTGMNIGDQISDTHADWDTGDSIDAAITGAGLFGLKGGGAAKGIPGATGPTASKMVPKHLIKGAPSKVPGFAKTFDDPAAKVAASKVAAKEGAEEVAKKGAKEGAEEVAKKGGKEVAEEAVEKGGKEVAKKAGLLPHLGRNWGKYVTGATGLAGLGSYIFGGDEEETPADDGTNTVEVPPAAPAAPAAPVAPLEVPPGVVVPGSPPAHNVARAQQHDHAARLAKEGRLPPRPTQISEDPKRAKAQGRAWEEEVKKRGDRLDEEDAIVRANSDRMKAIYNTTGGRDANAWDSLDMAGKKQAIRNFNINQGNARDRRNRMNNMLVDATNRWIDGGMQGPQPSAAWVEPEVMAQQKFDKAGFHQPQGRPEDPAVAPKDPWSDVSAAGLVGDYGDEGEAGEPGEMPEAEVEAPEQPFFSQDRGGISPEEFTKLTGLKRKGTGMTQNADDTWNTIESGGAFDRAGGMDSARDHLQGGDVEGGESMMAALENYGPGSGDWRDNASGKGRYTDEFGQQSMLGEGTVRLSPNDQEYGDANFESGDDALGYLNRFDQPDVQPQPAPPGVIPSSPRVQPPASPDRRQGPRMPSGPQALTAAALMALSKKFKIPFDKLVKNKAAAQGLMKQGVVQQGVKSPLATKAVPKTPVPGPAISSPTTRIPPGQPVRTAAPGGGTPAGPQIVTPKTPAPAPRTAPPKQEYVPRTGNPVATAPTSRLPGGAPAPRRRFDSPDELIKKNQQQFALN